MHLLRHTRHVLLQRASFRAFTTAGHATSGGESFRAEVLAGEKGVALHDKSRGDPVELHALWLRERTQDASQIFQGSGQRRFTVSKMFGTASALVKEAAVKGDKLHVVYGDGYEDALDVKTILAEVDDAYVLPTNYAGMENQLVSQRMPARKLWRGEWGLNWLVWCCTGSLWRLYWLF